MSENGRPEIIINICQKWEVSSQNGRVGISGVYCQELHESISSGKIQTVLISKVNANKISKIVIYTKKSVEQQKITLHHY